MTNIDKKKHKRWGKKFVDRRDWHTYEQQLVKRGEYLLDLSFVENWHTELATMNTGKRGAPYQYPESLIRLQAIWHAKQIPLRMIEGITKQLMAMSQLPAANDHTTVDRRINRLSLTLAPPKGENLVVFADGSGFRAVEGGEYLREKYGKKNRRWVQIVFWGDPQSKEPVSFEVNIVQSSELASAKRQLEELVANGVDIAAAGGDGAFDEIVFWNWLEFKNIRSILKPDRNAVEDSESVLRNTAVRYRDKHGYNAWQKKSGYGFRWPATEGILSAVKRIFGEDIHATSEQGMIQEVGIKFWAYQQLKRYGEA